MNPTTFEVIDDFVSLQASSMLGFTKAAALLSLARASTFVIPGSEIPPANPVIEYRKASGEEERSQAKR